MSAPHENHSDKNYPEDKVSHYPKAKAKKMVGKFNLLSKNPQEAKKNRKVSSYMKERRELN